MVRATAVPPFSVLEMADQSFERYTRSEKPSRPRFRTFLARLVTFGGALALTGYATHEMIEVVSVGGVTMLQGVMVVLFAITFGWIALAASSAVAGTLLGGSGRRAKGDAVPEQRTALVMPVYNEDPSRTFASLRAMAEALIAAGQSANFEIFVLSDTQNPDVYVQETARSADTARRARRVSRLVPPSTRERREEGRQPARLRHALGRPLRLHDRARRRQRLVCRHAADARAGDGGGSRSSGYLQTVPRLCGGSTLFARLQQFAGAVYGPIVARGIAAWSGQRRQLLGPQRDHPHARVRISRGAADVAGAQAVRRT